MGLFSSSDNNYLGIDIGDSSLKMVELVKRGKKLSLLNYGFTDAIPNFNFSRSDNIEFLAKTILKVKNDLGIKATRATVSLPSFSVFSSVININNFDKKKFNEMVIEEAKKVIPLPLSEMVLDWKIIPNDKDELDNNAQVFLTGSPKKLVKKYIDVFKKANIFLANLETETFSLIRSLLGDDTSTVMIIEMGANSTNFSIVKNDIPFLSRSIKISGKTITEEISKVMGISQEQAEQFKFDLSVSDVEKDKHIPLSMVEIFKPITNEIKYMLDLFSSSNKEKVERIILAGGGSLLFNFPDYLEKMMNIRVLIGDPWFRISYPPELRPVLDEVGPRLGVATGLALRGAE